MRRAALLLAALAVPPAAANAAAIDWSHARKVEVVAVDYRFKPNHLVFKAGVAYRLHLIDRGKEIHDFTAPAFFKTLVLGNADAMNDTHSDFAVEPGQAKDLYFMPQRPGHYPFACADHDWAGMTGDITVK